MLAKALKQLMLEKVPAKRQKPQWGEVETPGLSDSLMGHL